MLLQKIDPHCNTIRKIKLVKCRDITSLPMEQLPQLVSLSIHHSPKFNFLTLIAPQIESLEIVSNEDLFISAGLVSLQTLTARGNFKNINIPDTLSSLQNLHITDNASITKLSIPSLPKLTMLDLCECENLNELTFAT